MSPEPACGTAAEPAGELDASSLTREAERLRVAMIKLRRQLHRQDSPGLSVALYSALATVVLREELSIGDLAEAEHLPASAATRIVDRLQEAGLVERRPNPRDRRGINVASSPEGRRLLDERRRTANVWLAQRLGRLTAQQRATVGGALDVIEGALLGDLEASEPFESRGPSTGAPARREVHP